jgi:uncharacterized protein (TIGR03067 family)
LLNNRRQVKLAAMTPTLLLLTLTLAPGDAPTPPDGPPSPAAVRVEDAGELQGTWEVVDCVLKGYDTTAFKGRRWVFCGVSGRPDWGRRGFMPLTLRVDTARSPSWLDEAKDYGPGIPGIYRRCGDELWWALGTEDGRPSSFEPATGVLVWTLRRVKK